MNKKLSVFLLSVFIFVLSAVLLIAQSGRKAAGTDITINGYRSVELGMSKEAVLNEINKDALMMLPRKYIDGQVDVASEEADTFVALLENIYFKSGYFLFKDDSLYSMIIRFQPNQADFLEILSSLNTKYGTGAFINAKTVSWESSGVRLTLERPSTVKYMRLENTNARSSGMVSGFAADGSTTTSETTNNTSSRGSLFEGL